MKVKMLALLLALMALSVTASAQQDPNDPGLQDSLILQWGHLPDLAAGDSSAVMELIIVNDETLGGGGSGFKWIPAEMDLLSATITDDAQAAFDFSLLWRYKNRLDSSNSAQKCQIMALTGSTGLPAGRTLILSYNFKVTADVDSLVIDTAKFNPLKFVLLAGSIEIVPAWNGRLVYQMPQAVDVTGDNGLPTSYELAQNYPNPFNPETNFDFSLPKASAVELTIYNVLGQKVITLLDQKMAPGKYRETWRGTSESGAEVASGIYFYRLTAGDFVTTKKMMLLK